MKNMYKIFPILLLTCTLAQSAGYRELKNKPMGIGMQELIDRNERAFGLKKAIDKLMQEINGSMCSARSGLDFVTINKVSDLLNQKINSLGTICGELQTIHQTPRLEPDKAMHIQQAQATIAQGTKVLLQLAQQKNQIKQTNINELTSLAQQSGIHLPSPSDPGLISLGVDKNTTIIFNNFFFLVTALSRLALANGETHINVYNNLFKPLLVDFNKRALWEAIVNYSKLSSTLDLTALFEEFNQWIDPVFTMLTSHNQNYPGTLLMENECAAIAWNQLPALGLQLDPTNFDQNANHILLALQSVGLGAKFRALPHNIQLFYYYLIQTLRFYIDTVPHN